MRWLDDTAGVGALSQRYVRIELAGVLDLVRSSGYTAAQRHQLLARDLDATLLQLADQVTAVQSIRCRNLLRLNPPFSRLPDARTGRRPCADHRRQGTICS
ncbi:hypothetical protein ACFWN1_17660 [Streptomyces sp. NPDC058459]|uniref:hypothetical protein n=1 Tax=Streptomyces sp. NPDC058459 TaxID=3346508 RepID=UPI00364BD39A